MGIQIARDALARNGNPPLEFRVEPKTVLATIRRWNGKGVMTHNLPRSLGPLLTRLPKKIVRHPVRVAAGVGGQAGAVVGQ